MKIISSLALFAFLMLVASCADVAELRSHNPRPEGVVTSEWVPLSEISPLAVGAVIVSEDWSFYQHHGYDAPQMWEAFKEDLRRGQFAYGASTLTQQVARNVYLSKDKTLWRKLRELLIAIEIEKVISKKRILEIYLNIAEWGDQIYGIGPASRHYFGKSPRALNAKESAFLAMLLPSPKRYGAPYRHQGRNAGLSDYARQTIGTILHKMMKAKYITDEQRIEALSQSLY